MAEHVVNSWFASTLALTFEGGQGRIAQEDEVSPQRFASLVLTGNLDAAPELNYPISTNLNEESNTPSSPDWQLARSTLKAVSHSSSDEGIYELVDISLNYRFESSGRGFAALVASIECADRGDYERSVEVISDFLESVEDLDEVSLLVLNNQLAIRLIEDQKYQESMRLLDSILSTWPTGRAEAMGLPEPLNTCLLGALAAVNNNHARLNLFINRVRSSESLEYSSPYWTRWETRLRIALEMASDASFHEGLQEVVLKPVTHRFGAGPEERRVAILHRCRMAAEIMGDSLRLQQVYRTLGQQLLAYRDVNLTWTKSGLQLLRRIDDDKSMRDMLVYLRSKGEIDTVMTEGREAISELARSNPSKTAITSITYASPVMPTDAVDSALNYLLPYFGESVIVRRPGRTTDLRDSVITAVASLASKATEQDAIVAKVLAAVKPGDTAVVQWSGKVLRRVRWENVSPSLKTEMLDWLEQNFSGDVLFLVASFFPALGRSGESRVYDIIKEASRNQANLLVAAVAVDLLSIDASSELSSEVSAISEIFSRALTRSREEASRGMHSFGGIDTAAGAAKLLTLQGSFTANDDSVNEHLTELAVSLSTFLSDDTTLMSDKTMALDLLSMTEEGSLKTAIPVAEQESIFAMIDKWRTGQSGNSTADFDPESATTAAPYRFLLAWGRLSADDALEFYLKYTQSTDPRRRYEGVLSSKFVARLVEASLVAGVLLQLSNDPSSMVRSAAIAKLGDIVEFLDTSAAHVIVKRLVDAANGDEALLFPSIVDALSLARRSPTYPQAMHSQVVEALGKKLQKLPDPYIRQQIESIIDY